MRKKIKLSWIENDTSRKASFKKRRAGLLNKVQELTTLCDVSACLIIYAPGESCPAAVWPNEEEARRLVRRFRLVPEMERRKKMVNQEEYLKERTSKMADQLRKLHLKNGERATSYIMRQIDGGRPLGAFGIAELARVAGMLEEKMRMVGRRMELLQQFHRRGGGSGGAGLALPPPAAEEMSDRRMFPGPWFFCDAARVQSPDEDGRRLHCFVGGSSLSSGGGSGFQGCRNQLGLGNESNNVEFQPYSGSGNDNGSKVFGVGYGYFGGGSSGSNGNSNNNASVGMSDLGLGRHVSFEGNHSQEISVMPNTNHGPNVGSGGVSANPGGNSAENAGFRVVQSGQGINLIGVNNENNISNNVSVINMINYNISAGNDAGGLQGQAREINSNQGANAGLVHEIGDSMASGMIINVESSSSGTCVESSDHDAELPFDLISKFWPALFSPSNP